MCGIAGWVRPQAAPIDAAVLTAMTRALAHRGPDGEGLHVEPGCGLGHRRLVLLDRDGGEQPMANADRSVWVAANHEIYNYRELRAGLRERGHRLHTAGDTEVILGLYEEAGEACVDPLVGMFAFAVWDRRSGTLLLARDRFGIKPLYYHHDARGELYFASEVRSLLAVPGIDRSLDPAALRAYVRDLAVPEPRSAYRAIRRLPPAHCLVWRDGRIRLRRYWTPPERASSTPAAADAAAALEDALIASTALTLRSDEPLGLFLSGGLDSSLLAWAMRQAGAAPLRTFSVAFDEPQFDESAHSRAVAAALESEHVEVRITRDDAADTALRLVEWFDEPFGDSSALPTCILSGVARRTVTAVLAGEGADELFGGSAWHVADGAPQAVADLVAPPAKVVFPPALLDAVLSPDALAGADTDGDLDALPAGLDRLHRQLYADLAGYLPSDLLTKIDRMSMHHSLEVRVPYLNHPLAEHIWKLPTTLKQRDGVRKLLLRQVAARRLPPSIAARAKQGFAIPMDVWLWQAGRFRDAVYDTLRDARCRDRGLFAPAAVDAMLVEHDRLDRLHGHRLWTLFVLEHWLRRAC